LIKVGNFENGARTNEKGMRDRDEQDTLERVSESQATSRAQESQLYSLRERENAWKRELRGEGIVNFEGQETSTARQARIDRQVIHQGQELRVARKEKGFVHCLWKERIESEGSVFLRRCIKVTNGEHPSTFTSREGLKEREEQFKFRDFEKCERSETRKRRSRFFLSFFTFVPLTTSVYTSKPTRKQSHHLTATTALSIPLHLSKFNSQSFSTTTPCACLGDSSVRKRLL